MLRSTGQSNGRKVGDLRCLSALEPDNDMQRWIW